MVQLGKGLVDDKKWCNKFKRECEHEKGYQTGVPNPKGLNLPNTQNGEEHSSQKRVLKM